MHPVYAAKKCDPNGDYVREWCPELANLPVEYIHCPWEAPPSMLAVSGSIIHIPYQINLVSLFVETLCVFLATMFVMCCILGCQAFDFSCKLHRW